MTELIVIRHGETDWNVEGRIQGWRESELNARGKAQASALGNRFREYDKSVSAIYSSDLQRTMDTARPIAEALGLEVRPDRRLREWHLGVLETLLHGEAKEKEAEAFGIYEERIVEAVVPGGESIRQRYDRATTCLREIEANHRGECVVVVTHGGILDDVYRFVNGIDLSAESAWDLYNAGINRLAIDHCKLENENSGEGWEVVGWGDVGHLDGIGTLTGWGGDSVR